MGLGPVPHSKEWLFQQEQHHEIKLRQQMLHHTFFEPVGDGRMGFGRLMYRCKLCSQVVTIESEEDAARHRCGTALEKTQPIVAWHSSSDSVGAESSPSSNSSPILHRDGPLQGKCLWGAKRSPTMPIGVHFQPADHDQWDVLLKRGILQEAIRHKWMPHSLGRQGQIQGWRFPLFTEDGKLTQPAHSRWKNRNPLRPKYLWLSPSPRPVYYFSPDINICLEIHHWNGTLYLANGEPSALTLRTAGIFNCVCFFGETAIPPEFENDCLRWGVRKVVNFYDNDDEGARGSTKLQERLTAAGLSYQGLPLPYAHSLPAGADLNDLWQFLKFDRAKFVATVRGNSRPCRSPKGNDVRTPLANMDDRH